MPASSVRPTETSPIQSRSQFSVRRTLVWVVAIAAVIAVGLCGWELLYPSRVPAAVGAVVESVTGANANPIELQRPVAPAQLSAVAQLGKKIFFDPTLSASGRQSCASCHSPEHAYAPANNLAVQLGGPSLSQQGYRPPPSLMYLYRQPNFSIGPDSGDADNAPDLAQVASQVSGVARAQKNAGVAPAAPAMVPQGGMFWDGRADTLQAQASGPMLNPVEMANTGVADVIAKLERTPYRNDFVQIFGANVFENATLAMSEAMFAVARYQVEDLSFHPYTSKYDYWLEGKARLSQAELHGLRLFNDPDKANCAGCHLSKPGSDGLPPMFTDYEYEALGVPRNNHLVVNKDHSFFDMGICGPFRTDLKDQTQYCGMFLTPTLRNVSTRKVFFHNGVYTSLEDVMAFYNERNTAPQKFYPHYADGKIQKYDDLPIQFHVNIDDKDAPFDRKFGDKPAMTDADIRDIIAFLKTLNDGYQVSAH
ncbi:cytochrome c peroxidase [Paraburkholderia sp. BL23I1N1]|uniref:cytochrome-c peroxidase n=1 Tax=Paraburkholderia sp. BL23I1N1 TaxID=1938802 RepID=UPI000E737595|nr:cytochrome c peroxidase [Paraburkholderia sp. BL23I1N1]RKE36059.1 cytochrome c peroxidase [Paraburkholderia sp. BL23I1N1]